MEAIALALVIFIAIAIQCVIYQKRFFKNLYYSCDFNKHRARVGEKVELVETVVNNKKLPVPWLRVSIFSSKWLEYAGNISNIIDETRYVSSIFHTSGRKRVKRKWTIECKKRGVFEINNITLIGGDPLGIVSISESARANTNILVYPDSVDVEQSLLPLNIMQGETIVRRWISDDPFLISGVREYTPTDTMNRIHMAATAKVGSLMVKKCDFTSCLTVTIILNMQSIENERADVVDKKAVENGIRICAGFFDIALQHGVPFRFVTNASTLDEPGEHVFSECKAGLPQHGSLLEILAKLNLNYNTYFNDFLDSTYMGINDSEVILVTSFIDDEMVENILKLKKGGNNIKIIFLDYSADISKVPEGVESFMYRKKGRKEVIM